MPTNANTLYQDEDNINLLAYLKAHGRQEHCDVLNNDEESVYDCEGHGYHVDIHKHDIIAITQGQTWGDNKLEAAHVRALFFAVIEYIKNSNLFFEDQWESFTVYGVEYDVNLFSDLIYGDGGEGITATAYALKPDRFTGMSTYDPNKCARLVTNYIKQTEN